MFERKGKSGKVEKLGSVLHERTDERPGDEFQAEVNAAVEAGEASAVEPESGSGSKSSGSKSSSGSSSSSSGSSSSSSGSKS